MVESHPTQYPDLRVYSVLAPRGWREADGSYRRCGVTQGLDSEADARLIAAAPELLAAIKAHLAASPGPDYQGHRDQRDIDAMFRAVITMAEGTV